MTWRSKAFWWAWRRRWLRLARLLHKDTLSPRTRLLIDSKSGGAVADIRAVARAADDT